MSKRKYSEKEKKQAYLRQQFRIEYLEDGYLRQLLSRQCKTVHSSEWPQWLIDLYREHIKLKRLVYGNGQRVYKKA